jgi:hypothetical protein
MVTISGRVIDASDDFPVVNASVYEFSRPANVQLTDNNGAFTITVPDNDTTVGIDADGYGSFYGSAAMLYDDVILYETGADPVTIAKTLVSNHSKALPGTLVTAIAILLFFKLLKVI